MKPALSELLKRAEALTKSHLDAVRTKLIEECANLDSVGADALMLKVLSTRAGRNRYHLKTLIFIIENEYNKEFSRYNSIAKKEYFTSDLSDCFEYNPFDIFHYAPPKSDEDIYDTYPDHVRPLRFMKDDLLQWERELGTDDTNTQSLLEGRDV